MRDRARDVQRHRAGRRRAAPRTRGRTPACTARATGRPDRSGRARSGRSARSALRTNAKPSPIAQRRAADRRARRDGRCARYLRAMSTTARSISASVTDLIDGCLSSSSAEPPSPPPTISARAGAGCVSAADVDEVLVIEELVLLGRHEVAVEPEQLAERHGVVHFDRLECGERNFSNCARRPDEEAPVVGQVLGHHVRARGRAARQARPSWPLSHPCRRGGSPGTSCAAASARPRARETGASALSVLSVV